MQVVWRKVETDEFLSIGSTMWRSEDLRLIVELKEEEGVVSADLIVRNVNPDDSGVYECQITSVEPLKKHVKLQVYGKPFINRII